MEKTLAATMKHKVFPTTFQIVFDASLKAHKSDGSSPPHCHCSHRWLFLPCLSSLRFGLLPAIACFCVASVKKVFFFGLCPGAQDGYYSVQCIFRFNQPVKAHKNTHQTFENIASTMLHPVAISFKSLIPWKMCFFLTAFPSLNIRIYSSQLPNGNKKKQITI